MVDYPEQTNLLRLELFECSRYTSLDPSLLVSDHSLVWILILIQRHCPSSTPRDQQLSVVRTVSPHPHCALANTCPRLSHPPLVMGHVAAVPHV